ncbi:MAG: cytochrome c [Myxococcota bacterium]
MRALWWLGWVLTGCWASPSGTTPGLDVSAGQAVYFQACSQCHQTNGQGLSGAFPPLAGSRWPVGAPDVPIRIVLHGLRGEIRVQGQRYNNVMVAHKDTLTDQQIADVVTYIRNAWGNRASVVTPSAVAAVRAAHADRTTPWTAEELKPR